MIVPRLTKDQAAIMTAYTGVLCGKFSDFHGYAEGKLKRPIWTHEFADKELAEKIKEASKEDFLAICNDEKEVR